MQKTRLPNATAVLVLGISSISLCCCYAIPGIATGTIALILYRKDKILYNNNKESYYNISTLKTGKNLSIVGLVMSGLYLLYIIFIVTIIGSDALMNPKLVQEYFMSKF